MTIYECVQAVVADTFNLVYKSDITEDTRFVEDLNADSLSLLTLLIALEKEFSTANSRLDLCDNDVANIKTVGEVVTYLKQHGVTDLETEEVSTG